MNKSVTNYVAGCDGYQGVKFNNARPAELLQPVDPPAGRWTDIATDLITGFPTVEFQSRPVNAILTVLTVVDKFSNRVHFYPVSTDFPTHFSTQSFVDLLFQYYFPLHGMPKTVQSDRGPQFTSDAFQSLFTFLEVESKLSLARHQQSNGRVENRNKLIEVYLRLSVNKNSDWPRFLAVGEFVLNSQPSTSLDGKSPFEVDLGYVPTSPMAFMFPSNSNVRSLPVPEFTEILERYRVTAFAAHQAAFLNAKRFYDRRHTDVQFKAGASVYIDMNLGTQSDGHNHGLSPKLQTKFAGPFEIEEVLSPVNYQLIMPPTFSGHPVFHISQLRLKKTFPPPSDSVPLKQYKDGSQLVEISEIIRHRKAKGGHRLTARCVPTREFPQGEITSFPASALAATATATAPELVRAYADSHQAPELLALLK